MAYFACSRAARTGTDRSVRGSIARGIVKPTYINSRTGKTHLRGVIQSDVISGRDVGYVTSSTISSRVKAAIRASKAAGDIPVKTVAKAGKAIISHKTASAKSVTVSLHDGSPGTIKTAKTATIPKKGLVIAAIAAVITLFVANKVL